MWVAGDRRRADWQPAAGTLVIMPALKEQEPLPSSPLPHVRRSRATWVGRAWVWLPWLVLVAGLAVSGYLAYLTQDDIESRSRLRLERQGERLRIGLTSRIAGFENVLRAASGLFARDGRTTETQWRRLYERLDLPDRLPETYGLAFIVPVERARLAEYIKSRALKGPAIKDIHPSGHAPDLFVIQYHEPRPRGSIALGFDAGSVPPNRNAIELARDTGTAALAAPLRLGSVPGLALQYPIYTPGPEPRTVAERRARFLGCLSLSIIAERFVTSALRGGDPEILIELIVPGAQPDPRLYPSTPVTASRDAESISSITRLENLDVELRLSTTPAFWRSQRTDRPALVLVMSLALTLMSTGLLWSLSRTRERALDLADRMTHSLSAALQRHDLHLAHTPLSVIEWDESGRITTWNAAAERTFGITAFDAMGRDARRLLSSDDTPAETWVEVFAASSGRWQTATRRATGERMSCVWYTTPLVADDGTPRGAAAIVEDITNREQLEMQLLHSQKLEAVGRLAGGIAHDFNNLLTAILGHVDLASLEIPEGTRPRQSLDQIGQATERAAALTRQLLTFARQEGGQPAPVDLHGLIEAAGRLLWPMLGERIRLEIHYGSKSGAVRADPGQIEQVIMNLAINARDAMPEGGSLTIRTSDVTLDPGEAHVRRERPGPYVKMAFTDNGHGMSREVQAHVFEPFFTTKASGAGTGLGLAVCHGIVEQHGGFITVDSTEGKGSTFAVHLPASEIAPSARPRRGMDVPARADYRVMLVEDNEHVRAMARHVLQQRGCTVVEAQNGSDALVVIERERHPFDLILTDVVMPGITGFELARRLQDRDPNRRVLFMSGYAGQVGVPDSVLREGRFLSKPFTPDELWQRVVWMVEDARTARQAH